MSVRFAALRAKYYKGYLTGGSLAMTGDHIEHAVTYWAMWQLFHSPVLAGFAVLAHWLPHLFFGVVFGSLADRFDCRRLIQLGQGLFVLASLGWGFCLAFGVLQPWIAVVLLLIHGFAGAVWMPAEQLMIYDIVGPEHLPSGVRLQSTGIQLGQLVGPVLGAALLFTVGPVWAMFLNVLVYLPFTLLLLRIPYTGHTRSGERRLERLTLAAVVSVLRELPKYPAILVIIVMQGAVGFFIGPALLPLLPEFGEMLGQDESGLGYGLLLAAMATGAVVGGIALEAIGRIPANVKVAIGSGLLFAICCLVFALSRSFPLSLAALFVAGLATMVTASTSQTIVQLAAPPDQRGRFVGAYATASNGFRAGSGVMVGFLSGAIGITAAVSFDAIVLGAIAIVLFVLVVTVGAKRLRAPAAVVEPVGDPEVS